jgi:FkbM family methyltransferase
VSEFDAERSCLEEFLPLWGGRFVDVGAHVGDVCRLARDLRPDVYIVAIEPNRVNAASITAADHIFDVACGDSKRMGFLHRARDDAPDLLSSLHRRSPHHLIAPIQVRVRRLDELVQGHIDVLKIDVEGLEREVLMGASWLLDRRLVRCAVFEHFPPGSGDHMDFDDGYDTSIDGPFIRTHAPGYRLERWTDAGWVPPDSRNDSYMWRIVDSTCKVDSRSQEGWTDE